MLGLTVVTALELLLLTTLSKLSLVVVATLVRLPVVSVLTFTTIVALVLSPAASLPMLHVMFCLR